ncbi:12954_t:CDS:1 [Ambispora gerdemannii]|uniref:12954_t:CDS:1 n=1 Tax=Ambispora gerdemannii TaxID=144530 RepID=A0A9N8YX58_9GLOM|nr:12954_t:CDS:1 [Ambispora gerdemannii]
MGTIGEHTYDKMSFGNHPKSKYRNEIVNAFIEEIKQNPQDWKIIKGVEPIINGVPFNYGTDYSAVEHKSGRRHYKPDFIQIASFSDEEWTEIENALNHNKELDKENTNRKKVLEDNNYNDLTQEELNKEIKELNSEIEELKTNQNISISERQTKLQKKQEKLEKLEKIRSNSTQKTKSGNNFPTG